MKTDRISTQETIGFNQVTRRYKSHKDNDSSQDNHSQRSHHELDEMQNYASLAQSKKLANELKPKKVNKCEEFFNNLYGYTLMMWDGLGFFGTDHKKLGRLRG